MRTLLIQPPSNLGFIDRVHMHEPLALEYLGAGLKADGHRVKVLDTRIENDLSETLRRYRPELVGLTAYTNQVNLVIRAAEMIKKQKNAPFIVVGGHHATVQPDDFNNENIDLIVIGEGSTTLREIAGEFAGKQKFDKINGLAIPGRPMRFTEKRIHPPLDDLIPPDRTLTAPYRKFYFSEWLRPLASIRTSLGCVGRCNFCALWGITEGRYLKRKPDKVVKELLTLEEKNVFFCDDESMCDVERMKALATLIKKAGIEKNYFLYARVDTVVRFPELFEQWRRVGLRQVFIGLESFSDQRLQSLNKGVTTTEQNQAVAILKKTDILPYASFVVHPDFTRDDFQAMKDYVRRLKLNYSSFSILTPLPGTELLKRHREDLISTDTDLYDFLHTLLPTHLPLEDFYKEFAGLWQNAIPAHRAVRTFSRYGLRRLPHLVNLLREARAAMQNAYLDHHR